MRVTTSTLSLTVADPYASRDFLQAHLGYRVVHEADGFVSLTRDDAAADVVLLRQGTEVLPPEQRDQRAAGLILALTVTDGLEAEERRLREAGAPVTMPLREEPWGERLFQLTDPNGVVVQLVEWVAPAPSETETGTGTETGPETAREAGHPEETEETAVQVLTLTDENAIETPNARMTTHASPSRGSSELSAWTVTMTAGQAGPDHSVSREQVWTVTSGALEVVSGDRKERVAAGQTLVLSPGAVRRIEAPEDVTAYVVMRADGVVAVPGTEGTRPLPWAE
ncbi:VOC family protein [Streptomyces sp. NPDC101118]|uniref:VOC family protein n=1 Tax=Streptomyces sp. NPDC101118 TaxID=3366109 RepID=UPI0037FF92C6